MKRFMRILTTIVAVTVLATSLSGCASKAGDGLPEPPESSVTTTPAPVETEPETTTVPIETEAPETTAETTTTQEETTVTTTEATTTSATVTTAPTTAASTAETTVSTMNITPMSGIMYAVDNVNVRTGPGTEYERFSHLDRGEAVEITGQAENGWYRIKFKGGEYFVGGSYLSTEKPAVTTAATTTAAAVAAVTTAAATDVATTAEPEPVEQKNDKWIATWGCAMLTAGPDQTPSKPALQNNTVRQQVRVSVGGNKLRLVLSNEFGKSDLKIESIKIARISNPKKPDVELDTEVPLSYNGNTSFSVPAGKRITTDVIDFEFDALENLAITMKLGSVPSVLTCHTASRCSTWVVSGNHVSDNKYSGNQEMTAWYFIAELDTMASEDSGVIVCLGDSLTDGASVTTNGFSTYPHELARQLQGDDELDNLAVVNMGIGATALYIYGNDSGKNRLSRDVLGVPGVKYCVLLYGVNDIGASNSDISQNIINEYKNIIKKCHDKGIKVIGCTITPFKGNSYYSDLHERIRLTVNKFVTSSNSGFDAYIDLAAAVASDSDSAQMAKKYVSVWNDNLHFNDSGYKFVGKTVYEHIKEFISKEN